MIRENTLKLLHHFEHNNTWLISKWHTALETQILVIPGSEEEAHPTKNDCWSNGIHTWRQIRWPYDSSTNPNFTDFQPDFPFADEDGSPYIESVGTTWHNWETQESEGVIFDLDSIVGHKAGLTAQELIKIVEKLASLDYVTIIRSTSGRGYHILVFFQKGFCPRTRNHNEHTLVAEVVLQKMSEDAGFDLKDKIDCYGMIGWIWSTRAMGGDGFKMVKKAERDLKADEIPNWKDLPAKRMKMRPKVVAYDKSGNEIEDNNILGYTDEVIVLGKEHMKIIRALEETKYNFQYVEEHDLFHTHTMALKQVHTKLGLKGPFETSTSESNLGNCYIRAVNGGGFSIFRFGKGTVEHPLWEQTTPTTWCSYNQAVPPHKILIRMGAEYISESKHYEFESNEELLDALKVLGNRVHLELMEDRSYAIGINGQGCILKCFCEAADQPAHCDGWQRVRGFHKKVLSRLEEVDVDSIISHVDQLVRHVVRNGDTLGWAIKTKAGWIKCKSDDAKRVAKFHMGAQEAELYLGVAITNPWTLVNQPFEREHLPSRQWNLDSAQLVVQCATESGLHPHWDIMLNHLGQSWDEPLNRNTEMQKYGICTGAAYLRAWIACMIRFPEVPLPYIFLVGPQNTGKSLIHEVLRECISNGVVHGGNALTSTSGFNGEFEGKVLATIDDTDLSQFKGFALRLKSWINSTYIQIHKKGCQPYDVQNFIKIIQSANSVTDCVVEHGDTRITIGEVMRFEGVEIPKLGENGFIARCVRELPNFLYTLGTMQLPPMTERTRLPVISTEIKDEILSATEPDSLIFLKTLYHDVPGAYTKLQDAYVEYKKWCQSNLKTPSGSHDFKLQIGLKYPVHRGPRGRAYTIGNLSLNRQDSTKPAFSMEGKDGRHERV